MNTPAQPYSVQRPRLRSALKSASVMAVFVLVDWWHARRAWHAAEANVAAALRTASTPEPEHDMPEWRCVWFLFVIALAVTAVALSVADAWQLLGLGAKP